VTTSQVDSPCTECGHDFATLGHSQVIAGVTSLADRLREVLVSTPRERLSERSEPVIWSPLEYGCHVRDVLRFQRERVLAAQAQDRPVFESMRRDERAVEERYNEQDPQVVAGDLTAAATLLTKELAALDERAWARMGIYPWPAPEARTVEWVARRSAHELAHHLFDIHRLLASPGPALTSAIGEPCEFGGYDERQAALFAAVWHPAWTGNQPERLAAFYTSDTLYSDPQIPLGVRGREALTEYLRGLLARYPDWVWTQTASTPMRSGFVNYWHAKIPVGDVQLELDGVCLVELRDGLIARNQVFFDRIPLRDAVRALGQRES
jgi:hypothetical protein